MLTNILRKCIPATAALLDISFLIQLLFVPLAFALSTRQVQAATVPALDFSFNQATHEFSLEVEPILEISYKVEYKTTQGISDGFTDGGKANDNKLYTASRPAGTQSDKNFVDFEVESGTLSLTAKLESGEDYTFESDFVIENGKLELTNQSKAEVGYWKTVSTNIRYTAPQNDAVSVTFSSLPEKTGDLRIQKITLTPEQVEKLGAPTSTAYEITSSMTNGSFTYDLTLPNLTGNKDVQVQYSEDGEEFEAANADELTVQEQGSSSVVILEGLDHFTVFVVTSFEEPDTNLGDSTYPGWVNYPATVERVPSGHNGIPSSEGAYHGVVHGSAFTQWGGYKSEFPEGGYDTRLDVFLDMNLADGSVDKRFDFDSAINNVSGNHQRDFIFHLGTNPSVANQWLANASNNSPGNPGGTNSVDLIETGWYTLEHQFRENSSGVLEVTLNLYKKGNDIPVGSWLRTDPSDVIDSTVGGNRYGWFTEQRFDFDWIAIDNAVIQFGPTAPTLLSPLNNTFINASSPIANDWEDVPYADYYTYESYNVDGSGNCNLNSIRWNEIFTSSQTNSRTIADGLAFCWRVKAVNSQGESDWSQLWKITIDNTGPVAPIISSPLSEQNFLTTPILNDWNDISDPSGISHYRIKYVYDDGHSFTNAPYRETTSSYRYHSPGITEQGGVTIQVQAFDNAGNEGTWSEERHYYYDTEVPSVPTGLKYLTPDGSAEFACGEASPRQTLHPIWNANTEDDFSHYEYTSFDAPNGQIGLNEQIFTIPKFVHSWVPPMDGVYGFAVRSVDEAGNKSPWAISGKNLAGSCQITFDSTAPSAPTSGQPHDTYLNSNNFDFTWDAAVDNLGQPITYEFQSSLDPTESGGVLTSDLLEFKNLSTPTIHSPATLDGTWYWQVRTVDQAGNTSPWSQIWNVTLDTKDPIVNLTSPTEGDVLAGSTNFTGTIEEINLQNYNLALYAVPEGQTCSTVNRSLVNDFSQRIWQTPAFGYLTNVGGIWDLNVPFDTTSGTTPDGDYLLRLAARDDANNRDPQTLNGSTFEGESIEIQCITVKNTPDPSNNSGDVLGATSFSSSSTSGTGTGGSPSAEVCGATSPNAIPGLNISTTASGATLSWTKPTGSLTHYALEFFRLDANGNETGRYGVDQFGDANTTSFTIDNLPGNSSYRFELFAVNDCAPGSRAVASSALITAPGAADFGLDEVVLTPNTGEAQVLGATTDEEILEGESPEENLAPEQGLSLMGQVLGASTENCSVPSWWWILLPAFLAILGLLHVLLAGRNLVITSLVLLGATGYGLFETLCGPWVWIGATSILTIVSIFLRMRKAR